MMLCIILMVGAALAGDLVAPEDHLECDVPADGAEMQCWAAKTGHDSGDMCADSSCPMAKALHVHVQPAEPVAMRSQAPWQTQATSEPKPTVAATSRSTRSTHAPEQEPRGLMRAFVYSEPATQEDEPNLAIPARREPPRQAQVHGQVYVQVAGGSPRRPVYTPPPSNRPAHNAPARVVSAPAYQPGTYDVYAPPSVYASEATTAGAVSDFRASQAWVEGVRAENRAYQTQAQVSGQRADAAETARKAEEARRLAAQAQAKSLRGDLDEALDVGGDLLDANDRLRAENARLRAQQDNTNNEEGN